jgi:phosphoribosylformylglycinamidine synthase
MALDYRGEKGIATSIGHAPVSALVDPISGSQASIAEALTNLVWAPIEQGLEGVSLSANWMWPAKKEGENYRLYQAVKGVSDFACSLGVNIPTGKDSLSMTQKYKDGEVHAPGTVIISAVGEVSDVKAIVEPALQPVTGSKLFYIDFSQDEWKLGGSSYAQTKNALGTKAPEIKNPAHFKNAFEAVQSCISKGLLLAGHDISAGGMITTLLEMNFPNTTHGAAINLRNLKAVDDTALLFSEKSGIIVQVSDAHIESFQQLMSANNVAAEEIGNVIEKRQLEITTVHSDYNLSIDELRDVWYKTSHLLDRKQSGEKHADWRFENYKKQPLQFAFPTGFKGTYEALGLDPDSKTGDRPKAAIIREKGVNGDREMAYAMHLAGFDVKDVHMTDLTSGAEDLSDVNMIAFVGGFSNSDVLGSAKGWAGAFLYNEKAKAALDSFYGRKDTLSLGICNGCQLMGELELLYPEHEQHPKLKHNASGKFESSFLSIEIPENNSVMLSGLAGCKLGIWAAHGEGRFELPQNIADYNVIGRYAYEAYPGNPNGSDGNVAGLASADGRHLAIMPHFERSIFPWNWGHYPAEQKADILSPWILAFKNAREWVEKNS